MQKLIVTCITLFVIAGFCTHSKAVSKNEEIEKFVKDAISKDKVVIFSKTYCPHSKKAKEVFESMKHSYTAIEVDKRNDGNLILDELAKITGARTVPRVFINGEFIGGGADIKSLYDSGRLQKILTPIVSAN